MSDTVTRLATLRAMLDSVDCYDGGFGWLIDDQDRRELGDPVERYVVLQCMGDRIARYGWLKDFATLRQACQAMSTGIYDDVPSAPLLIFDLDDACRIPFRCVVEPVEPLPAERPNDPTLAPFEVAVVHEHAHYFVVWATGKLDAVGRALDHAVKAARFDPYASMETMLINETVRYARPVLVEVPDEVE